MGLFLMNRLRLCQVYVPHIYVACYWKFLLLHYTQILCQSRLCIADHAYITYLMLQRLLRHFNGRKLDHRKFWWPNFFNVIYKNLVRISQEARYDSATKPNRLMLCKETVAVCCENHTEHTGTLCRQNAEFSMLKRVVRRVTTGI
jgi:hypothetical protein